MTELLVLADDLTGALEAGALCAQAGTPALVQLGRRRPSEASALVIDLETRHSGPGEAMARVEAALEPGVTRVFVKTDSTLRGAIGATLGVFAGRPVWYMPGYPALGRTVRDGRLYVHGVPLEQTAFAADPHQPALTSDVREATRVGDGVRIFDAETENDVAAIAAQAVADAHAVCAGPAGFLRHLLTLWNLPRAMNAEQLRAERGVVVNGSKHPASREQVRRFIAAGLGRWMTLEGSNERQLAASAESVLRDRSFDVLVVFGGDTARAILGEMGVVEVVPLGELMPGVPVSRLSRSRLLVTKAGGFGAADLLVEIREKLNG